MQEHQQKCFIRWLTNERLTDDFLLKHNHQTTSKWIINLTKPNFLFVSLTTPRSDLWSNNNESQYYNNDKINVRHSIHNFTDDELKSRSDSAL